MSVTIGRVPGRSYAPPFLLLAAAIPACLFLLPLAYVVLRSWQAGSAGIWEELFRPRILLLLVNTLTLAISVTLAACAIGLAAAWAVERSDLVGRRVWRVVAPLPLAIPAFVTSYAWSSFGGSYQGMGGAILILTLSNYPLVYLPVAAALRSIDPTIEDVSRSLGRGSAATFIAIVLPQIRPALGAGALLVFTHMLAEFGALSLLRVQTFTTSIFESYQLQFDSASAALQSAILMLLCLPVAYGEMRLRARTRISRTGRGSARRSAIGHLGRSQAPVFVAFSTLAALSLGVPIATLVYWLSVGASRGSGFATVWPAVVGSLSLSFPGAVLVTLLALPLVLFPMRHPGRLATFADRLPYAMHGVPGLVIALALIFLSIRYARPMYQTAILVFAAYAMLFLPLAQSAIRASVELVPPHLEEMARGLGRRPFGAFCTITLPLIVPGLGAALALMTLELMRELTATLLLAPIGVTTLSIEVWSHTNDTQYAAAAPFALLLVLLSAIPVFGFTRRSLEVSEI